MKQASISTEPQNGKIQSYDLLRMMGKPLDYHIYP